MMYIVYSYYQKLQENYCNFYCFFTGIFGIDTYFDYFFVPALFYRTLTISVSIWIVYIVCPAATTISPACSVLSSCHVTVKG